MYNDTLLFADNERDESGFIIALPDHSYLRKQREALQLSQQAVSDMAGINIRQYQRFESGERSMASTSLRIGLSICDVLKLDPHRFV